MDDALPVIGGDRAHAIAAGGVLERGDEPGLSGHEQVAGLRVGSIAGVVVGPGLGELSSARLWHVEHSVTFTRISVRRSGG